MPVFEYNGKKYNVKDEHVDKFIDSYPKATTIVERDGKKYRVKSADYNKFMGVTTPQQPTLAERAKPNVEMGQLTTPAITEQPAKSDTIQPTQPIQAPNAKIVDNPDDYFPKLQENTRNDVARLTEEVGEALNESKGESARQYAEQAEQAAKGGLWKSIQNAMTATAGTASPTDMQIATRDQVWRGGQDKELANDIDNYEAAEHALENAQRTINEADINAKNGTLVEKAKSTFVGGAARGFGQKLFDVRTWDMGATDLKDQMALNQALDAAENGTLTESQQALLDAKAQEMATQAYFGSYVGRGYKAGSVTAESLPFMLEMCINPASTLGKSAASRLARYAIGKYGKRAAKSVGQEAVRVAGRALGDVAGAATMTATTGSLRAATDAMDRMSGGVAFDTDEQGHAVFDGRYETPEDVGTAIRKAFAAQTIQYGSEMLGHYFAPALNIISKPFGKIPLGRVQKFLDDVSASDFGRLVTDFQKRAQWNGNLGEFAEEMSDGVLNALIVGDQTLDTDPETGVFNRDNLIDTYLGVNLLGFSMSSIKTVGYGVEKYQQKRAVKRADVAAADAFGSIDEWDKIKTEVDAASNEELPVLLGNIISNPNVTDDQKTALMVYVGAKQREKGAVIGEQKRRENPDTPQEQVEIEQSFDNGAALETPQEKNDAQNMFEYQQQQMRSYFGLGEDGDVDAFLGDDPIAGLRRIAGADQQAGQVILDYLNAKATVDGVFQRMSDDVEAKVAESDAIIQSRTNNDNGMIQRVTLNNGNEAYVVSGDIVMTDDGKMVNTAKSSESIIVRDAITGKLDFSTPSNITSAYQPMNANVERETLREQVMNEYSQRLADEMNGTLAFAPGDNYTLVDEQGAQHNVQIVADNGDGTVAVVEVMPDGVQQEAVMAKSTIQEMSDTHNQLRLGQYLQDKQAQEIALAEQEKQGEQSNVVAEQQPVSAMSRIPIDEQGEQMFEQAPVQDTWAALVELNEGDTAEAVDTAQQMYNNAKKELDKAQKQKPKVGTSVAEIQANKAEYKAKVSAAQAKADYWSQVANFEAEQKRLQEALMAAQRKEQARQAAQALDKKGRYSEELAQLGDYLDFEDYVMRSIVSGGVKFKWSDNPNGTKGLGSHLGLKGAQNEMARRIWLLNNEEGEYPETAAERLISSYNEEMGYEDAARMDTMGAMDTIINVLSAYDTPSALLKAIQDRHNPKQEEYTEEDVQYIQAMREAEAMGMTADEWLMYQEVMQEITLPELEKVSDGELNTIFVELYQEQDERSRENTPIQQGVSEREGRVEGNASGNTVLSEQQPDNTETSERGNEQSQQADDAGQQSSGDVPAQEVSRTKSVEDGKRSEQDINGQQQADSRGVVKDTTRSVEGSNDRSDIRVFEEGLDTSYNEYSEYGERDRREAESQRLVNIAKQHGLFVPIQDTKAFGAKYSQRTGESSVYFNQEAGKVYKVKDPYAKSAMKSGVQPEDAAFEHLVHNLIFPETNYTFEGISEELGDVRIVLSQSFIQSKSQPTKEKIAGALAARGLFPEDNYSFGNDFVSVTDVEGDNVLLGEDGTVYFIDPIIRFKKPLREILADIQPSPESISSQYTITPAQYTTKKGKVLDMHLVKFAGTLTKEQQRAAKELAKAEKGWYDREQGGFMMRSEESAKQLADTILNNDDAVSDAQPVSMIGIQALNNGDVLFTEPQQPKEQPKDEEYHPIWQYSIHIDADGYTTISRDDVSSGYPIGDARFRYSTDSPEEMLDILRNPLNGMQEALEAVGVTLENKIKTRELDRKIKEERRREYEALRANGYNGYKIGDEVIYKGKKAKIHDLEEYGEHRPVLDTGLAPVMYEVAEWSDIQSDTSSKTIFSSAFKDLVSEDGKYNIRITKVDGAKRIVTADLNTANVGGEGLVLSFEEMIDILNSDNWQEKIASEPKNEGQFGLVSDERMAELKDRLRKKLGGQMNIGIDPEILAIGLEIAVGHLDRGVKTFTDFAKVMISDLGDVIRPYLKAFYNGARELPEVVENGLASDMTSYDEVQSFDVANFDKQGIDAFATAETVTREAEVAQEVEVAQERIKKTRSAKKETKKKSVTSQEQTGGLFDSLFDNETSGNKVAVQYIQSPFLTWYDRASDNYNEAYKEWVDSKSLFTFASFFTTWLAKKYNTSTVDVSINRAVKSFLNDNDNVVAETKKTDAELASPVHLTLDQSSKLIGTRSTDELHRQFAMTVKADMLAALDNGTKPYRSILDLRKRASELGMEVDPDGRTDILLQELVEDGLVRAARIVVESGKYGGKKSKTAYDAIVQLYDMQPTIAARSSNRIKMQQYSTPLPMAFVADMFAISPSTRKVLEPTAGNGMMVFAVPREKVYANELDETRIANLRDQQFASVTQQDAMLPFEGEYDAVIANPPFGNAPAKDYDGKSISGLDPQIVLNSLAVMQDSGKAAIIIGGNMEYASNGSIKNKKSFFTYLYDHYNVKGVIDMSGGLYAKQGTTFPTRMILIDGRRSEEERAQTAVYPPIKDNAIAKVETFEQLYETVVNLLSNKQKTNGTEILRSQAGRPMPVADNTSGETDGNGYNRQSRSNDQAGRRTERRGGAGLEASAQSGQRSVLGERGSNDSNSPASRGTDTIGEPTNVGGGSEQRTVVDGSQRMVGVDIRRGDLRLTQETKKRELTEEKLPYRPHNTAFSLESVAPAAMVEAMDKVLSQIEEKYGNIDEFVRKELGYDTIEAAHIALAAEQMDSVAMAIYQMKQGQAMIIGDQTGVGKGRQMAALIRWAVRRGEKPIFITQKADLFSDIYRDLVDIGSGDLVPFIFNSDGAMVDSKGNAVHKPLSPATMAKVFASGKLPDEYNFAVLTYSQVNTGDDISQKEADELAKKNGARTKKSKSAKLGKATPKATFLRSIAADNYLFLDESHTAAGSSNTGAYLQSILRSAKAATFASATFAKRPDTMPLYAIRTAMSQAKVEPDKMIAIIEKGGVTLQEIMSRELTNAGQMVRRERDMSDVITDWKTITDPKTVERARTNYDRTIAAFNAIIKFQEDYVKPMIESLSAELAIMAESASVKKGTDKMGVENVPFASKTYNYTKQLMLALKVDAIANEVEAEIKQGRHPVIALESTMESSIKDYAVGEIIDEPTFSASLLRGLDTVMQYTIKDEDGNERHANFSPQQLGAAGAKAYYDLREFIIDSTSDIFISPLDAIIERLREKGYKVGELTGRSLYVERNDDGRVVVKRRTDKDKKRMQREFNSGELDVLILNKSASTGISLHASEKFSDQRQRTMIIAQPLSDINDYMQMIGRIDRTGQVHRGYYINLGLPVPAENRFLMMLSTKLKSLNANTTTSQDSESNDVEAPDLLNKYGSQVVIEYLRDNPEIYEKMGAPLKGTKGEVRASDLDEYKPQEDDARKVTGYVALLNTKEQEEFYDDVVKRYTELIKYLNDTGSNDLKITVMPLRAKTIEKRVSSEGIDPNGNNPFARNSYVEQVEMDVLRKPMKAEDIRKTIDQINGENPEIHLQNIVETIRKDDEDRVAAEEKRYERAKAKAVEDIAKQADKINAQKNRSEEEKREAIDIYTDETNEKVEEKHRNNLERIAKNQEQLLRRLRMFSVSSPYLVPDNLETAMFDFASPAIFCGYKTKEKKITASTTLAVFATLDGRRRIEVKLSQIDALLSISKMTDMNWDRARSTTLENWDNAIPTETRKLGYIMTGNILQAIADTQDEMGGYPGQLISYTDIDGNIHDGILMPDKWNASMLKTSGAPLIARLQQIKEFKPVTSHDGKVEIMGSKWANEYYLTIPKTKKDGAIYFENPTLLKFVYGGNFYPYRGKLRADISADRIEDVVKELTKLGVKVKEDTDNIRFRSSDRAEAIANFDADFAELESEYQQLDKNDEQAMAEWRAKKKRVVEGYLNYMTDEYALPCSVFVFDHNDEQLLQQAFEVYINTLASKSLFWKTLRKFARQWAYDNFKSNFVGASTRGVRIKGHKASIYDIGNGVDLNKKEDWLNALLHENTHYVVEMLGISDVDNSKLWEEFVHNGKPATVARSVRNYNTTERRVSELLAYSVGDFIKPERVELFDSFMNGDATVEDILKFYNESLPLRNDYVRTILNDLKNGRKVREEINRTSQQRGNQSRGEIVADQISRERDSRQSSIGRGGVERYGRSGYNLTIAISAAEKLAEKLGVPIRVIRDVNEITDARPVMQARKRASKGWYDVNSGEVVIVAPNIESEQDAKETILHEIVGHKGLRKVVGNDVFNAFLDNVFRNASVETRAKIVALATKNGWDFRLATEEYIAELAVSGFDERENRSFWEAVRDFFRDMLSKAKIALGYDINDNDLRYMLWRSYQMQKSKGAMAVAEDVDMQRKLGVGNFRTRQATTSGYTNEEQQIIAEAQRNGTYLKAPNGKPTNLTPKQWVQVRTKAFKRWFGDWEKAARIEKLRNSKNVSILGDEFEMTADPMQNRKNAIEFSKSLRGEYTNKDTGAKIVINSDSFKEVLHHDIKNDAHVQSIAAVPDMVENGIYITSEPIRETSSKRLSTATAMHYYVCGLEIGGTPYTAKFVVAELANGERYYDHSLTQIEKGDLLNRAEVSSTVADNKSPLSEVKDKRLISILQTSASKIVDANGEPLVVWHGGSFAIDDFVPNGPMHFGTKVAALQRVLDQNWGYDNWRTIRNADNTWSWEYTDPEDSDYDKRSTRSFSTPTEALEDAVNSLDGGYSIVRGYYLNIRNGERVDDQNTDEDWENAITNAVDMGRDGLVYRNDFEDEGEDSFVAFSPTQIKSAEINSGEFDLTDPDIRFRSSDSSPAEYEKALAREAYENRLKKGLYQSQEALQDSMLSLKVAMETVAGKKIYIEDIAGYENAYLGENRLSSVNKAEADAFARTLFKPMLDEVAKLAKNEDQRMDLIDYMMAKHGIERNAYMRRAAAEESARKALPEPRKPISPDEENYAEKLTAWEKWNEKFQSRVESLIDKDDRDYAGLTALTGIDDVAEAEEAAQHLVNDYEAGHNTAPLWEKVQAVNAATLSKLRECGLMSEETFNKVSTMYEFYIPLRGFDEKTSNEEYAYLSQRQGAFNAPIRKAQGRSSKADDPFANMQSMAESAIMQGNRNALVKQRFLNFVLNHPSDLVSVSELWLKYDESKDVWEPAFPDIDSNDSPADVERKMAEFERKMQENAEKNPEMYKKGKDAVNIPYRVVRNSDLQQHQVIVKRGGRDYVLTVNGNPRLAQALNGLTNPDNDISGSIGELLKRAEQVTRWLSAAYTTRNPDFIVSNFLRDLFYSNTMVWIKERPNYALRFNRNYAMTNPVKMKRLYAKYRNGELDMNDRMEAMFYQFMMNGGETGYVVIRDIEQRKNEIRRELKKHNGQLPISRRWDLLSERFDELNRSVENCARFAAFVTSREMGRSIDRSIYDAKEISVNFNKKGSGDKFLNTTGQTTLGDASASVSGFGRHFYVFWNAALQGTTNFGRQFKRHPAKAFAGAATMFLLGALIAAIGDDDEDEGASAYYNLPEYVRRTHILFRVGDSWISIPLPVEYRALYGLGELMISTLSGREHLTDGELASAIAEQVSQILPLDFMEGGGGFNAFVPSAAKPLWESHINKSWTGLPLYRDYTWNEDLPNWTKAYKGTGKFFVNMAEMLNEASGGDRYTKGAIDINPAKLEYVLEGYFGGMFSTVNKMTKMAETAVGDREYEHRNMLLLNRIVKSGDERAEYRAINNEYYRLKNEYKRTKRRLKGYKSDTDKGIFDYAEKIDYLYNSPEYRRYEIFEQRRKDIEEYDKMLKDESLSAEARKDLELKQYVLKQDLINAANTTRDRK